MAELPTEQCPVCKGSGRIYSARLVPRQQVEMFVHVEARPSRPCAVCRGTGRLTLHDLSAYQDADRREQLRRGAMEC